MDSLNELKRLISDACDALNAAADILSDDSLPISARLKAHDRCLESHDKIRIKIADLSSLLKAEFTALEMLMTYQIPETWDHPTHEPVASSLHSAWRL